MRSTSQNRVSQSSWLHRGRHAALVAFVVLGAGVGLAACGGPSTPGVATGSTSTTTGTTPASSGGGQATGLLAYSACMRAHGVANFPDPSGTGGINKSEVVSALEAVSNSRATSAQSACAHLIPAGGGLSGQTNKPITAQDQRYYLRAVACMRTHGFPNFPDPTFSNGTVSFAFTPSINTNSPQYGQAKQTCEKLIPAGLPDSGHGG